MAFPCNGPIGITCSTPTQFASFVSKQLDLRVTQPVYRGGRTEAQTRQAVNTVQAARAQTLAVETTVFQAVAQAYLDVVRDQVLLAVNRNNEYVLGQEFESTRIRVEIGELTGTDLAQAQAALEQAKAQVVTAEGQLEISRANYTRAVGRPPGRLTLPRERPVLPASREEALSLAARGNPNVISAGFTELAARDNIDVVRGQVGGDPASIAFDAVSAACARGIDLVLIDTAGRLHTKVNLMDELTKVRRSRRRARRVASVRCSSSSTPPPGRTVSCRRASSPTRWR